MFENDENDEYNYNGIIGNSVNSGEEKKDAYAGYTEKTEVHEEPKEKKKGFLGAVKFVGMAAAFGIIAGGVFLAVNYAAGMATGKVTPTGLPSSNVLYYELDNDAWCCARPSGTEPKIKFYMGVKGTSFEDANEKLEELTKAVMSVVEQ